MKSHEIARLLLSLPNRVVKCSVNVSKDDSDYDRRVFGDMNGYNELPNEIVLLFEGELND